MNYKVLQYTYSVLFDLHHNGRNTNTVREDSFTFKIWIEYLEMIRAYFINTEIVIHGKKQKVLHVNSYGGRLKLSYFNNNINEIYSIDLADL